MTSVELSAASIEAIAQRVAELMRAPAQTSLVLTRGEAKIYVKRPSEGAFVAWCKRWKIRPASHGRYARADLDLALEREGGLKHTPATLRHYQDELRKPRGKAAHD